MNFISRRVVTIWDLEVLTTWRETVLNVNRNSIQLKGIVSHDEAELNANYPISNHHKFVSIHA